MIVQLFLAASAAVTIYAVFMVWIGRGRPGLALMCCGVAAGTFAAGGLLFAALGRAEPAVAALAAASVMGGLVWLKPLLAPADTPAPAATRWMDAALVARSRHLRVDVDVLRGDLRAEVRIGRHTGRMLGDLARAEAVEVLCDLAACGDITALSVAEAWLDRHDAGWRRETRGRHYGDLAEPARAP